MDGTHGAGGCTCCMGRWALAEVGRCPRAKSGLCPAMCPQGVPRTWESETLGTGGARGTPITTTPEPPPRAEAHVVVFGRGSHPAVAQPVPLLVQCFLANHRGTESP